MEARSVRSGKWRLLLLVAIAALAVQLLFLPLPKFVIRPVAENSAAWLLNDNGVPPSGLDGAMQKLVGEMLQQSLIAHFHSSGPEHRIGNDAAFAGAQLRRLRPMLINQKELYHDPAKGPIALSGLGWCDMANGLAGRLLAHDFDHVQIVGVRDSASGGGHSFGRFWSEQFDDWLYFDIWAEEIFVFRAQKGRAVEYLFNSRPLANGVKWPDDVALVKEFHARAREGFVHNKLQASVGSYVFHRLANLVRHGSMTAAEALAPLEIAAAQSAGPSLRVAPPAKSRAITSYATARVEHFLGNRDQAAALYEHVQKQDRGASVFGSAASIFAARLRSD
jgi:hypothetical protein